MAGVLALVSSGFCFPTQQQLHHFSSFSSYVSSNMDMRAFPFKLLLLTDSDISM
jgi:hypothetical membrane protein